MADYVRDRDLSVAAETERRRAEAAEHPDRWRVGGSPGTEGCTIYRGNLFVGMVRVAADAAFLVGIANDWQRQQEWNRQQGMLPPGVTEAEAIPCKICGHSEHRTACLTVLEPALYLPESQPAVRCGCTHGDDQ